MRKAILPTMNQAMKRLTSTSSSSKYLKHAIAPTNLMQYQSVYRFSRQVKKTAEGSTSTTPLQPPSKIFDEVFHIENQQKSIETSQVSHTQLQLNGKILDIIGIPIAQNEEVSAKNIEIISELCQSTEGNSATFIAVDPSYHIADKRTLQKQLRKQILFSGQDIDQEKILDENPMYPQMLEELILDLLPLDFHRGTETEKIMTIQKITEKAHEHMQNGYFTKVIRNPETDMTTEDSQKKLRELYDVLNAKVFGESDIDTFMYPQLQEGTFINLMQNKEIYLGQVPRIYERIYMANSIDLELLKRMFKESLKFASSYKMNSPSELGKITPMIFSHFYSFINTFYMYYVLQQIAKAEQTQHGITVFLKAHQVAPLTELIVHYGEQGFKKNESFLEFLQITENERDNDEILLEKHAILDTLFADQLWEKPYIKNPFPYLQENYTKLNAKDKSHVSQAYSVNFRKYQSVAKEFLKPSTKK